MICPECNSPLHRTVFTRQTDNDKAMRRKKCKLCGHGWYTVEVILPTNAVVHLRDASGTTGIALAKSHRNILFQ